MADANLTADAAKSAKSINELAASDQAGSAASKTYQSSSGFRAVLPISVVSLASLELMGCAQIKPRSEFINQQMTVQRTES